MVYLANGQDNASFYVAVGQVQLAVILNIQLVISFYLFLCSNNIQVLGKELKTNYITDRERERKTIPDSN